jgi:hypothetical protein
MGRSVRTAIILCALVGAALARPADLAARAAVQESLAGVHPRFRADWLRQRGLDNSDYTTFRRPDSGAGLRLVGRWSYGPAYDVDCRVTPTETLLALARGSGVSLVDIGRSSAPHVRLVTDIDCRSLAYQVVLRESLLFVATRAGVEVYDVTDAAVPILLSEIAVPVNALDARDTLLCLAGPDTFSVYGIGNPAAPRRLGYCLASGSGVSINGDIAFVADVAGLRAIDISNPAAPAQVGTWGSRVISVAARNTICCVTQDNANQPTWLRFSVLNIANPASIQQLSHVDSCGGYDIYLDDTLAFLSGYYTGGHEFRILSITDSTHPVALGQLRTLSDNFGVWGTAAGGLAAVADDFGGLAVINASDPAAPLFDTLCLRVGITADLAVDRNYCYVASDGTGMKVLDVTSPARPEWVGDVAEPHNALINNAVAARDSFAYVGWFSPWLRVIDVSDPERPELTASCTVLNPPEDLVLRDSFLYVAEDYKFQIVNVARPREPQVVGTCNLGNLTYGMRMRDSLAYVCSYPLAIISTADPAHPTQVGSMSRGAWNVFVRDSLAYLAAAGLIVWNVADPTQPFVVDSLTFGKMVYDVLIRDTVAYLACSDGLRTASVANVHDMRVTGFTPLPYYGWRLTDDSAHIYVAVQDAGICVFDTAVTGVAEPDGRTAPVGLRVTPRVSAGRFRIAAAAAGTAAVYNPGGRRVAEVEVGAELDISALADGVYVVVVRGRSGTSSAKVVKTGR